MKRALTVGTAFGLASSALLAAAPAAHASGDVIAESGSDAASKVMTAVLAGTGAFNVPAQSQIVGDFTVPGDSFCNAATYNATGTGTDANGNPKIVSPLGAGQGQTALDNSVAKTYPSAAFYTHPNNITSSVGGCIDIARLASKSTNSSDESYEYALDAVGWASPSLNAPANLTLQDLRDIWNCNLNDWGQVGGSPGPIVRVLPPFGGGVRKFFINSVLGISTETATVAWVPPTSGTIPVGHAGAGTPITCPAAETVAEQSNGNDLLTDTNLRPDYQKFILPYDSGNWVFQATGAGNPTIDVRGGVRPGGIIGVAPTGSFPAAYSVRWTGTAWRLNDGTILGTNETGARSVANVSSTGQFDTTLTTGVPGTFTQADVGLNVQGSFINDGTVITAISAGGANATISPGANANAIGGVIGTITVGWAVVSEHNPVVNSSTNTQYPGVRFLANAVNPLEPDYLQARALIGFDDTTSNGAVSNLCNGTDASIISDFGFLPLSKIDPSGPGVGNDTTITCRKQ